MIIEKPSVKWPPFVALRGLTEKETYRMRFVEEKIVQAEVTFDPIRSAASEVPIRKDYQSQICDAHYLARLYARPLSGKLPAGHLTASLDGEVVADADLSVFLLPDGTINAESVLPPWKPTVNTFKALPMMDEGNADGKHPIGFMIPNGSRLELAVTELSSREECSLEVGAIVAHYSTKW